MARTSRTQAPVALFTNLLKKVQRATEPKLRRTIQKSQKKARTIGDEVSAMVDAMQSLSARGGKRLRPALAVTGALTVREDAEWELPLEAGVSLELLQTYFLIHDDWMDQDDERRGGPTTHVELARHFGSKELGASSAILAGDLALALALEHFSSLAIPQRRFPEALRCFAEMQTAAIYGQQLDVVGKTPHPELTYELKTASYTVKGPLLLGAILAGASPHTLQTLESFALPSGVAFQLRDDWIGVFGDPKRTGKPRGNDLISGKNTFLVQHALQHLNPRDRSFLQKLLGNRKATKTQIERGISLLEDSGAAAATEARIAELNALALAALKGKGLSSHGRALLEGALSILTDRDR